MSALIDTETETEPEKADDVNEPISPGVNQHQPLNFTGTILDELDDKIYTNEQVVSMIDLAIKLGPDFNPIWLTLIPPEIIQELLPELKEQFAIFIKNNGFLRNAADPFIMFNSIPQIKNSGGRTKSKNGKLMKTKKVIKTRKLIKTYNGGVKVNYAKAFEAGLKYSAAKDAKNDVAKAFLYKSAFDDYNSAFPSSGKPWVTINRPPVSDTCEIWGAGDYLKIVVMCFLLILLLKRR